MSDFVCFNDKIKQSLKSLRLRLTQSSTKCDIDSGSINEFS